jgi:integrase
MKTKREITKTSVRGILKRGDKYVLRVKMDGRQIWRTLQATNIREAGAEAKALRATLLGADEEAVKATAARGQYPTLAELVKIYKPEAMARLLRGEKISKVSIKRNIASLTMFAGGSLEISCGKLTKDALMAFSRNWLSGYEDQPLKLNRRRTSLLATHVQAKGIFSEWALECYKKAGLSFPASLEEWKKAKPAIKPASKYRVPLDHPELVASTLAAGPQLNGALGVAWVLCFELALRAGEAAAFKMSWITKSGDHYRADIIDRPEENFTVKGTGRQVAIHANTLAYLVALRAELDHSGPYALPGDGPTPRLNVVSRELAAWMRATGWASETFLKCAHELRKLQGSRWFSDPRLGPAVAQEWLGHADVSTTCKYYAALATNPEPLPPAGIG